MYEWCQDKNRSYQPGDAKDDINIKESIDENPRLIRGGAFYSHPSYVRSANRDREAPSSRSTYYGFRPSRTYP
jgi:formylglycine-generating enzyme required for sulfatase activity